jgi:hypothetical protein
VFDCFCFHISIVVIPLLGRKKDRNEGRQDRRADGQKEVRKDGRNEGVSEERKEGSLFMVVAV